MDDSDNSQTTPTDLPSLESKINRTVLGSPRRFLSSTAGIDLEGIDNPFEETIEIGRASCRERV